MREPGYYWVKVSNLWVVAEWSEGVWFVCGNEYGLIDSQFDEIDEARITRNPETTPSTSISETGYIGE